MASRNFRDRISRMDQLFRSGQAVTLSGLALEFGVTERTICRDLAYMKSKLGLPILRHPALGYRYTRSVPPLDSREAVAGPNGTGKGPSAARPSRLRRLLETLHRALYERKTVWVACMDSAEPGEGFPLNPLFLSRIHGEVVLFGIRPSDGAPINVPIGLLDDVRSTQATFEEPIPCGAKVRESEGWLPPGSRHEVRLRFPKAPEWARALLITADESVELRDGELVIRCRTDDLERAVLFIRLLGPSVQVEAPPELLALLARD